MIELREGELSLRVAFPVHKTPCCHLLMGIVPVSDTLIVSGNCCANPVCVGTGKTKTILGLLSILLHSGPKGAFAAASVAWPEDEQFRRTWEPRGLDSDERRQAWLAGANWLVEGNQDARCATCPGGSI